MTPCQKLFDQMASEAAQLYDFIDEEHHCLTRQEKQRLENEQSSSLDKLQGLYHQMIDQQCDYTKMKLALTKNSTKLFSKEWKSKEALTFFETLKK